MFRRPALSSPRGRAVAAALVSLVAVFAAVAVQISAAEIPAVQTPSVRPPVKQPPAAPAPAAPGPTSQPPAAQPPTAVRPAVNEAAPPATRGELVYVPIYSSIYYDNGTHTLELAATLSIHNVNPDRSITVQRADYYDTEGKLIKKYLARPLALGPLQTTNIVVEKSNTAGGTGANFLVEWQASPDATSPLVEAVMVNAASNLGIAFTTSGKVVRQTGSAAK